MELGPVHDGVGRQVDAVPALEEAEELLLAAHGHARILAPSEPHVRLARLVPGVLEAAVQEAAQVVVLHVGVAPPAHEARHVADGAPRAPRAVQAPGEGADHGARRRRALQRQRRLPLGSAAAGDPGRRRREQAQPHQTRTGDPIEAGRRHGTFGRRARSSRGDRRPRPGRGIRVAAGRPAL